MAKSARVGRIHISKGELSKLLGFDGGRVYFVGWMPEYGEIGVVIEHPEMPLVREGEVIPQVERQQNGE